MAESVAYIETEAGRRIGFRQRPGRPGAAPGIVFLGGLASDMTGTKATHLDGWAAAAGHDFLRLDYSGHGVSSGTFEEGCVGDWAEDAAAAINHQTRGPQILVGSSLGGWIALLLARDRRVDAAGVVGMAAAPDFTERLIRHELAPADRAELLRSGRVRLGSETGESWVLTRRLVEDGASRLVLDSPCPVSGPVRLLHGTADRDVPVEDALRILDVVAAPDVRLTLVQGADHRMSGERELALLGATLAEVMALLA